MSPATTTAAPPNQRILGWDLLRGLCALAVAIYHLLYWMNIVEIHTLGTYGVYLFFILSGASLSYSYSKKIEENKFKFRNFLWIRYARLAPLYLLLMIILLPWKIYKDGASTELAFKYVLNAALLHGFVNPSASSALIGGWSLGIEFIYYLLFPFLISFTSTTHRKWTCFILLLAIQICWIHYTTLQSENNKPAITLYHQAPAFIAYFMGGILLGAWRRMPAFKTVSIQRSAITITMGFCLLIAFDGATAGEELVGWRGLACASTCFGMAWAATQMQIPKKLVALATHIGDATYGLYLIHPVVFFGVVWAILPRLGVASPEQWPSPTRELFIVAVIACSVAFALLSERYFERPLRNRSKRHVAA